MNPENFLVLIILAFSIILFISEKIRADVVALLSLLALTLTGILSAEEAFSGFSNPAVITVWSVFIVSGGVTSSGIGDKIAHWLLRLAGKSQRRLTAMIMVTVGFLSAFMNNIGAVAILLPAVLTISKKTNLAPSKLLIPLAWASLMGGNMTLIGTPPNILASGILASYPNLTPFNFFDFTPMGLIVLTTGIVYMLLIGNRLLPERTPGGDLQARYPMSKYLSEVQIMPDSPLVGKTIKQAALIERFGVFIVHIHPHDHPHHAITPSPDYHLNAGDDLHIQAEADDILRAVQDLKLTPIPNQQIDSTEMKTSSDTLFQSEITLAPYGAYDGKTLEEINFRARYGISVLAIQHNGQTLFTRLGKIRLHIGDSLLVQGPAEKINLLANNHNFLLLDLGSNEKKLSIKSFLSVLILLGVVASAASGLLHISTAMLIGAVAMILTRILTIDEAYQSIEWKSVFLIAGMLPMGIALETTGTANLIANFVINLLGNQNTIAVMIGLFIMTALLTEVISNAAAAVLVVPIAIDAALTLGANPKTFVMAIVIAASTSFLMPIGHQVNIIVFGPGGYKFTDYPKVGVWLNIIMLLITIIILPLIWPLFP